MKYIQRQKKSAPPVDPRLLVAGVLLLLIVLMLWFVGRMLFGGKEESDGMPPEANKVVEEPKVVELLNSENYLRETTLQGLSGHAVNGAAQMRITFSDYEMTMAASLPPLDPATERYEAWMLQPGIADYFSAGTFFARADGWYGLAFKENLAHIPSDPQTYTRILITRESLRDDEIPSNVRIAEGFFTL